ncbi:MAG: DNA-binding protein WhiA, partial [Oscillospiraceae bacterium]
CYGVACFSRYFDTRGIVLFTEAVHVAKWAKNIFALAGIEGKVYAKGTENSRSYEFSVKEPLQVEKMLALFGHTGEETAVRIHDDNFICDNCFSAFASSAFLCCGTVTNPSKGYMLEFVNNRHLLMDDFYALLIKQGFSPSKTIRKGIPVVYFHSSSQVEDILTFMGATSSALEIMQLKVYKDFRNKANRITNCETANIDKMVAANRQVLKDITVLEKHGVLQSLPEPLKNAALLRKENPALSLADLAAISKTAVSKSGLSHQYKRIAVLAAQYANKTNKQGDNGGK